MPNDARSAAHLREMELKVHKLEMQFVREMEERGFDPAQAETVALPSALANLYTLLEEARAELAELLGDGN